MEIHINRIKDQRVISNKCVQIDSQEFDQNRVYAEGTYLFEA